MKCAITSVASVKSCRRDPNRGVKRSHLKKVMLWLKPSEGWVFRHAKERERLLDGEKGGKERETRGGGSKEKEQNMQRTMSVRV